MATAEKSVSSADSKKLSCNGHVCTTCSKCCDWRFTGDAKTGKWISNYEKWNNDDWKRWRRNRMWTLYQRKDDATCTSVSRGPGNTYDDPIFGGHSVTHNITFGCGDMTVRTSHDFIFVGDQISSENSIVSSVGNLCVCNIDKN